MSPPVRHIDMDFTAAQHRALNELDHALRMLPREIALYVVGDRLIACRIGCSSSEVVRELPGEFVPCAVLSAAHDDIRHAKSEHAEAPGKEDR